MHAYRVLVVDDNIVNRKIVKRRLEGTKQFRCDCAESGEECLRIMEQTEKDGNPFSLILMDEELGESKRGKLQGHNTVELLRKGGHSLPIIMFTTKTSFDSLRKYSLSGADALLRKGKLRSNFADSMRMAITVLQESIKKSSNNFRSPSSECSEFTSKGRIKISLIEKIQEQKLALKENVSLCYSSPCRSRRLRKSSSMEHETCRTPSPLRRKLPGFVRGQRPMIPVTQRLLEINNSPFMSLKKELATLVHKLATKQPRLAVHGDQTVRCPPMDVQKPTVETF